MVVADAVSTRDVIQVLKEEVCVLRMVAADAVSRRDVTNLIKEEGFV